MPQNLICSWLIFFFWWKDTSNSYHHYMYIYDVFSFSSHLKVENVRLGIDISFQSGLLNICCYSFFIITVCCLQSSLSLFPCVIKSIKAFGKAVLQHPLEPFKLNSAFRSAFCYSVCILISLVILHTNHKASYILSYENLWVPFHFYGKDLYSTKLYWIFTGFILLGIMLFKSRKQQCLIDAINSYYGFHYYAYIYLNFKWKLLSK